MIKSIEEYDGQTKYLFYFPEKNTTLRVPKWVFETMPFWNSFDDMNWLASILDGESWRIL